MVHFDQGLVRFNYRVAGVALKNGKVLLDRNMRNQYWVLPGGHPEMMETMQDALCREMQEEIGARVEVSRLLWVVENFFERGKQIHELSFYFLMEIVAPSPLLDLDGPFVGDEGSHPLAFQWHPLDENALTSLPLYPPFLPNALLSIPTETQHIILDERHGNPFLKNEVETSKTDSFSPFGKELLDNFQGF